jgi:hypothetical protein
VHLYNKKETVVHCRRNNQTKALSKFYVHPDDWNWHELCFDHREHIRNFAESFTFSERYPSLYLFPKEL